MAGRRQPFDLHEIQANLLAEEMAAEAAETNGGNHRRASRAAPNRRPAQFVPPPQLVIREPFTNGREYMSKRGGRGEEVDVHELLKREAFGAAEAGCDDHFEKGRPCPSGVYGISDQYVTLDSWVKVRSSNVQRGHFMWNFMIQGVTGEQVVGVRDKIDTVTEIQLGEFAMPILPEVPYVLIPAPVPTPNGTNTLILTQNNNNTNVITPFNPTPPVLPANQYPASAIVPAPPTGASAYPWTNNPYSQVPFNGYFTIQMQEAGLQSFSDRGGTRHHYDFRVISEFTKGNNPILTIAQPLAGVDWDTFTFTDPLKDVHGITLIFRNPDVPIRFDPDVIYDVQVAVDANGYITVLATATNSSAAGHGLNVGDRIYFAGFKSGNPTLDAFVNRADGLVVSGDPNNGTKFQTGTPLAFLGFPNQFWTDPAINVANLNPVIAPVTNISVADVYVAKRRLRIPMRLRRIVGRLTNYAAP